MKLIILSIKIKYLVVYLFFTYSSNPTMAKFLLKRKILVKYRYKLKGVELVQLISLLPNSVIKNLKIWKHDKF